MQLEVMGYQYLSKGSPKDHSCDVSNMAKQLRLRSLLNFVLIQNVFHCKLVTTRDIFYQRSSKLGKRPLDNVIYHIQKL